MISMRFFEDAEDAIEALIRSGLVVEVEPPDLLAPMTCHKDTHPAAWVEPVSTAKPYIAGLGKVAAL